jgi:hypothetical protein
VIAPAVVVLILFLLLAAQGLVVLVNEVVRTRREAAYWDVRANRPEQYDWAKELDL